MVKQENFTAMKGHCAVGTKIKMRTGEIFEIKDSGRYKKIVDVKTGKDIFTNLFSAASIEYYIYNYNN